MTTDSARLGLPYIEAGQAQKEWTHNEALARLDIMVQASVDGIGVDAPPASPAVAACWIVGAAPTGAWAGHAGAVAGWTEGGWRFVAPRIGMAAWSRTDRTVVRFVEAGAGGMEVGGGEAGGGGAWRLDRSPPIAVPAGGATIDAECRAGVTAILAAMREHGWLA